MLASARQNIGNLGERSRAPALLNGLLVTRQYSLLPVYWVIVMRIGETVVFSCQLSYMLYYVIHVLHYIPYRLGKQLIHGRIKPSNDVHQVRPHPKHEVKLTLHGYYL